MQSSGRLRRDGETIDGDGTWLRAAIETDAASGAVAAGVTRRMHTVMAQLRSKFQTFRWTGLHAQTTSLALFDVDRDVAAWRHLLHL